MRVFTLCIPNTLVYVCFHLCILCIINTLWTQCLLVVTLYVNNTLLPHCISVVIICNSNTVWSQRICVITQYIHNTFQLYCIRILKRCIINTVCIIILSTLCTNCASRSIIMKHTFTLITTCCYYTLQSLVCILTTTCS